MKELRLTFEDEEFLKLERKKARMGLNWHDFIIKLSKEFDKIIK